jgi:hypothetical protein
MVMCRAWRKMVIMKGSGRWRPYQEIQDSEVIMVARSSGPWWSDGSAIAHRRLTGRQ